MPAALERRLQALESKAVERTSRFIWMSWRPRLEDDEVSSAQHCNTVWKRHHGEDLFSFEQRVELTVNHQPGPAVIWATHDSMQTCQH